MKIYSPLLSCAVASAGLAACGQTSRTVEITESPDAVRASKAQTIRSMKLCSIGNLNSQLNVGVI